MDRSDAREVLADYLEGDMDFVYGILADVRENRSQWVVYGSEGSPMPGKAAVIWIKYDGLEYAIQTESPDTVKH